MSKKKSEHVDTIFRTGQHIMSQIDAYFKMRRRNQKYLFRGQHQGNKHYGKVDTDAYMGQDITKEMFGHVDTDNLTGGHISMKTS